MTKGTKPLAHLTRRMLNRAEAAAYSGVSPSTFERMIADRLMPGPIRTYSQTLWDVRVLDLARDLLRARGGHFREASFGQ